MADITIRGAGIIGLSIAWACLLRGARVRLIDPGGPGGGASGGIVGALAPHVPENWTAKKQFQLESLEMAGNFWAEVEQVSATPSGYARTGRLQTVADERALELAQMRAASARSLWPNWAEWRVIKADDQAHWPVVSPTGWLIHDTLSARLHPQMACRALAGAIGRRGGQIVTSGREDGLVVHATGLDGLSELNAFFDRLIGTGVKGQAALLDWSARGAPQLFADGLHIIAHQDGTVAVGSTSERDYADPAGIDAALDQLIAKAAAVVPQLAGAPVLKRWAGVRPRALSRAPILGPWPGRAGHFIANGGFKIGFGMAPKVAQVMAELLVDGHNDIPEDFRLERSL